MYTDCVLNKDLHNSHNKFMTHIKVLIMYEAIFNGNCQQTQKPSKNATPCPCMQVSEGFHIVLYISIYLDTQKYIGKNVATSHEVQ